LTAARIDLRLGQSFEGAEDVHNWTICKQPLYGRAATVRDLPNMTGAAAGERRRTRVNE
jgi:hypothetical protein